MGSTSKIQWTDATWNPVTGCTRVSSGCDRCYAERFAERWRGVRNHPFEHGFDVTLRHGRLGEPLRWKTPRRIFVNSMSDLFHDDVPTGYIAAVFAVMARTPQHTYQLLTKRHGRMRALLSTPSFWRTVVDIGRERYGHRQKDWPTVDAMLASHRLPNVWLGVSAEDQRWADIRIPALLDTPATVRWVSAEPLLGPLDLTRYLAGESGRLDWVVVGGESGPGARPAHPDWFRLLQSQCAAAGVPFFFKQAGASLAKVWRCSDRKGGNPSEWPIQFVREYPRSLTGAK